MQKQKRNPFIVPSMNEGTFQLMRQRVQKHRSFPAVVPEPFYRKDAWEWAVKLDIDLPLQSEVDAYQKFKKIHGPSFSKKMTNYTSLQAGIGGNGMHYISEDQFMLPSTVPTLTSKTHKKPYTREEQGKLDLQMVSSPAKFDLNQVLTMGETVISMMKKLPLNGVNISIPIENGSLSLSTDDNGITTFTVTNT